ncbi:MAG: hypothetical protein Q8L53_07935 [Aestuariivirga sp.]|nr:hypothetical protein [Aestuariivirga sp.]
MADVELVGRGLVLERDLYVLYLESPEDFPDNLSLGSPSFACLLAWDSRGVEVKQIAKLAGELLKAGAVYICAWGPDCERVHDIFDEEIVGSNPSPDDPFIMTTWHSRETLAGAIWFVLMCSNLDEDRELGCASTLGVTIGNLGWHDEIRSAFRDSDGFCSSI